MSRLAHMLNQIKLNKYPRISGAYTKPEGFPGTECFHPACRESKCWRFAKLYNHALSKKKLHLTRKYAIEDEIIAPPFRTVWK